MAHIGQRIKMLMDEKGVDVITLANKLGKTKQAIYEILNKENINTSILWNLAIILNVPVMYFLTEEQDNIDVATKIDERTEKKMISLSPKRNNRIIRYWPNATATGGNVELFDDELNGECFYIFIPFFTDCTDAVNLFGDSMAPKYNSGEVILLKKWQESFIQYGSVYLIITRNGNRMVKYLKKSDNVSKVVCASENKDYADFEIDLADILQLYIVKGSVKRIEP